MYKIKEAASHPIFSISKNYTQCCYASFLVKSRSLFILFLATPFCRFFGNPKMYHDIHRLGIIGFGSERNFLHGFSCVMLAKIPLCRG